MNKLTTLVLATAAVLAAGIGSASAHCSLGNFDVGVDGNFNVVELIDDGRGNQITGRVFGSYNELQGEIDGYCNTVAVLQDGSFNYLGTYLDGNRQKAGVMLANGAVVDLTMIGSDSIAMIEADAVDGSFLIDGHGNKVFYSNARHN